MTGETRTVLSVIHFPVFGGPHNQVLQMAEPLRREGWHTVVLLPDEPGNAADRLRSAGVEMVTMPLGRLRATPSPAVQIRFAAGIAPQIRAIRRVIRERNVDLVQIGGLVNPHAAIAARLEGIPVVWQLLDTRAPWPLALAAMSLVERTADAVMSTGRMVADAHPRIRAIEDRLVPFFPPVDVDLFKPRPEDRAAMRAQWGVSDTTPVVGCVANINPQKGIVELVEAFGLVRRRMPDARLILVGSEYATHTAYSAAVRDAISTAGLLEGTDVIFTGPSEEHQRALAAFDVFAFSPVPRGEGITTAVLEAMSAALPVVATSVAGLPEAIEEGVSGRLIAPGDVPAFAEAIAELLADKAEAGRLGEAARARAVERFSTDRCVADHITAYRMALARRGGGANGEAQAESLAKLLRCPACFGALETSEEALACRSCGLDYPIVDGIPVLSAGIGRHELRAGAPGHGHKAGQAGHFDHIGDEEFEITRPHGTPSLYRFLLREKFRRATNPIRTKLPGATALTVCGGSGMDAEFLARSGAHVIASDISLNAARRTRERARRFGLQITPVVADVERLPFGDEAFDLVLVHDGLHHLEDPYRALGEMARVARRWVSISEPTRALATRIAVKLGLALEREEAGNLVVRLTASDLVETLRGAGYRPLRVERYAMYYRHEPGRVMRWLSIPGLDAVVRTGWAVANALIGPIGNKMAVVAERVSSDSPGPS